MAVEVQARGVGTAQGDAGGIRHLVVGVPAQDRLVGATADNDVAGDGGQAIGFG